MGLCRVGGSKTKNYLLHEFLNLIPEGIFPLRRDGEVEFLLGDGFDVVVQVNKVRGGLKVDFAMVGVHCFVLLLTYYGYGDDGPSCLHIRKTLNGLH